MHKQRISKKEGQEHDKTCREGGCTVGAVVPPLATRGAIGREQLHGAEPLVFTLAINKNHTFQTSGKMWCV